MNTFDLIQEEWERFIKAIKAINDKIPEEIFFLMQKNTKDGRLIFSADLSNLEEQIKQILISHGYKKLTDQFIGTLDTIKTENIDTYSNLRGLEKFVDQSELLKLLESTTIKNLKGTGIDQNIINPLSDDIRQMSLLKMSLGDFREKLQTNYGTDQKFTRYINQVSFDTMSEFDGSIKKVIIDNYHPTGFYYVGDLIDDSRPLCIDLKNTFKGKKITFAQLKAKLDIYAPGGIPSDKKIEVNGKMVRMGSGMKDGTTVDTFCIYCGGYGCRHQVELTFN